MYMIDPIDQMIGIKLKEFRKRHNLTQQELGKVMGVSFQQVQKYESGKNRISLKTVQRLCKHYNASPLYFFVYLEQDMLTELNCQDFRETEHLIDMHRQIKSTLLRNAAVVILRALAEMSEKEGQDV